MLDHLFSEWFGFNGFMLGLKVRMSVLHIEGIRLDDPDLIAVAQVGDLHGLAIPLQLPLEILQANCQVAHHYHLIERSGIVESGAGLHPFREML